MLRTDLQRHNEYLGIPLLNILFSISCKDTFGDTGLVCCICYVVIVAWCHKIQMSTFEHLSFLTLFSFDHKTKLSNFRGCFKSCNLTRCSKDIREAILFNLPGGKWTGLEKELTFLFRFCSCALFLPPWLVTDRVGSF